MAPQTLGGWGSPAITSGVDPGDLHWAKVTVSRAQAQGEDEHLLWRWSKGLRYPYHHEMGTSTIPCFPCTVCAWQPPRPSLEKNGCEDDLSWSHRRAQPGTSPRLPCQQCSYRDNRASFQPGLALLTSLGWRGMSLFKH